MTYSFAAIDRETGQIGIVVQSKAFAVGMAVPWARPKVGAICTQANTNMKFGPDGLALLEQGVSPKEVISRLLQEDEGRKIRQIGVLDASGQAANYTGENCMAWAGGLTGDGWTAQGNILAGPQVLEAMAAAYTEERGSLAERLLDALKAGQEAGGDIRGMQSAALLVVGEGAQHPEGKLIDLRVDDHPKPIDELIRIYHVRKKLWDSWTGEYVEYQGDIILMTEQLMRMRQIPSLKALAERLGIEDAIRGSKISQRFLRAIANERQK
ncbi:MAG: DUF1028 domain-containing protein [Bacillota bacterium]